MDVESNLEKYYDIIWAILIIAAIITVIICTYIVIKDDSEPPKNA